MDITSQLKITYCILCIGCALLLEAQKVSYMLDFDQPYRLFAPWTSTVGTISESPRWWLIAHALTAIALECIVALQVIYMVYLSAAQTQDLRKHDVQVTKDYYRNVITRFGYAAAPLHFTLLVLVCINITHFGSLSAWGAVAVNGSLLAALLFAMSKDTFYYLVVLSSANWMTAYYAFRYYMS